jgi:U3 small nucleolar RNA-associated protein 12
MILQTHSSQLIATRTLRTMLLELRIHLREALEGERGKVGYNLAGLRYLKGRWLGERVAGLGVEDLEDVKGRMGKKGKGKRKRVVVG